MEKVTIGTATLYLGDCIEAAPEISGITGIVTDPPYSSGARTDANKQVRGSMLRSMEDEDWFSHDAMTTWGFSWFLRSVLVNYRPALEQGAHIYCFTDWRQMPNVYALIESAGYRVNNSLVWAKTHFGMGTYWRNQHEHVVFGSVGMPTAMAERSHGTVMECKGVSPTARVHPTEKPVELIELILKASGVTRVLDPFMGSGTTGVACARMGREFVGVECERQYFDKACERIEAANAQGQLFGNDVAMAEQPKLIA
jgi:site-specific DNA-methyltransferase (adenine-specific)